MGLTDMTPSLSTSVARAASTASHIASLCQYLAEALGGNPETSSASEAVEGLRELSIGLSNRLHEIAEETA